MSRLDDLIKQYCPNGVAYKEIGSLIEKAPKSTKGVADIKAMDPGEIIAFTSGDNNFFVNEYLVDGDYIFMNDGGQADTKFYHGKAFYSDHVFAFTSKMINVRFLFHYLLKINQLINDDYFRGGGIKNLVKKDFLKIEIPVPPLPIQEEIVRILDNFTKLTAELTAELTARKRQYKFYRDFLLTFDGAVKRKKIGLICKLSAGGDVDKSAFSATQRDEYNVPIYSNGIGENALYGYTNIAKINEPAVTIAARGTIGYCELRNEPFYPIIRLICAIPDIKVIIPKFLKYCIELIRFKVPEGGIPQLTVPMVKEYEIPVPPLEEQSRIVGLLDKFDSYCNDISKGLPAEIAARQRQYEYYRDRLLTFRRLNKGAN